MKDKTALKEFMTERQKDQEVVTFFGVPDTEMSEKELRFSLRYAVSEKNTRILPN